MIDLIDINYKFSNEESNDKYKKDQYSANPLKIIIAVIKLIYKSILYSPIWFKANDYRLSKGTINYLLIYFTTNQSRAIEPLYQYLKNDNGILCGREDLPLNRAYLLSLFYSPIVFYKYIKASGYLKKAYASEFVSYCLSYGYSIEIKKILRANKPKFVILSNDHTNLPRTFMRESHKQGIKTVYIQHASVTGFFPPLEFDYAFLDGKESYDKYSCRGEVKSKVYFLGSPRFDIISQYSNEVYEKKGTIIKLGLAINNTDKLYKIEELLSKIQDKDIEITIRPHPACDVDFWTNFAKKNGLHLSDAKKENPFYFIQKNDIFITNESSFHLDVALMSKTSFLYNLSDSPILDIYNYLKNNLIKNITDLDKDATINVLKHGCNEMRHKTIIQYYVSNYDTREWGKSSEMITEILKNN